MKKAWYLIISLALQVMSVSALAAPAVPQGLYPGSSSTSVQTQPNPSDNSVLLSWFPVKGATYYKVKVNNISKNKITNYTPTLNTQKISVNSYETYRWLVISCDNKGCSSEPVAQMFFVVPVPKKPSCTISVSKSLITEGDSSSITANCTNNPTNYTWTVYPNTEKTPTGTGQTISFNKKGTYKYTLVASNPAGSSSSVSASITVNPSFCENSLNPQYSKEYNQSIGGYVFKINLCRGAELRAFNESPTETNYVDWTCENPKKYQAKRSKYPSDNVSGLIDRNVTLKNSSLVMSGAFHNGRFRHDGGIPSFLQVVNGLLTTSGGDSCSAFTKRVLVLNHTKSRATIANYSSISSIEDNYTKQGKNNTNLYEYTVIAGLDPDAEKDKYEKIGRNFACVSNTYDGGYGTVIFAISDHKNGATIQTMQDTLIKQYGCDKSKIIQFDGSTVSQASEKTNNKWVHIIPDRAAFSRGMPQVFYVK